MVYPGLKSINFGGGDALSSPPFLTGLGPVFLTWIVAPLLTLTLVTGVFLIMRTWLLRGEDPFHKVIWVCSNHSCPVNGTDIAVASTQCSTHSQLQCLWTGFFGLAVLCSTVGIPSHVQHGLSFGSTCTTAYCVTCICLSPSRMLLNG